MTDEPRTQTIGPPIPITVVSDFNCPWCYVAHKELHIGLARARQEFPTARFQLEYRPFELDPTLPKAQDKPMCKIACYMAKFGEKKMEEVCELLKSRGRMVGIDFRFAGKTRQTTNAHRLSLKAFLIGGEQAQTKMMDALFAAYFERETDIGCFDFLSKAAESTGIMTYEEAREFIASDKLVQEVQMLLRHSSLRGINGVPCTIIANYWAINGAERADVYYHAFRQAYFAANRILSTSVNLGNMIVTQNGPSCTPKTSNANSSATPSTIPAVPAQAPAVDVEKTPIAV